MHGVSPALPEDAVCPERQDEGAGGGAQAQGGGKAVVFVLNKIGACRPAVFPPSNSQIDLVPRENA